MSEVEITFIGGEPLLAFGLIKELIEYTCAKRPTAGYIFYASTNGTVLNDEMKKWLVAHKNCFVLGLSLDGRKETHDYNRSNSFDLIDIDFFLKNYPQQGIKMTLSDFSLNRLAGDIKYLHSLGFSRIQGVNLYEGAFDWSGDEYITALIPQLQELVEYYVENDSVSPCQMLDKHIDYCAVPHSGNKKWCGIGVGTAFFDVTGKQYPCNFVTPMTFPEEQLSVMLNTDFSNDENFADRECIDGCYIYPICPTCAGANYMNCGAFNKRDKRKCKIQRLISLYIADMQAKLIIKNPSGYSDAVRNNMIIAIKKVRELYLEEFRDLLVM